MSSIQLNGRPVRAVLSTLAIGAVMACGENVTTAAPKSAPVSRLSDIAQDPGADSDWVSTPGGWYHKSCVHEVPSGSRGEANGMVHRPDGTSIQIPPCHYPHGQRRGQNGVPSGTADPSLDSWIISRSRDVGTAHRSIVADWTVPLDPSVSYSGAQVYYAFPGLSNSNTIIQPVLAYHHDGSNVWQLGSWSCGPSCTHSTLISTSAGHSIHGTVTASGCSGGTCTWTIVTQDVTSSTSTTWTVTSDDGYQTSYSGVIEVHGGLTSCGAFPTNALKMTNVAITDASGTISSPSWFETLTSGLSPSCGWASVGTSTTASIQQTTLAAFVSGESSVNTGANCNYSASAVGGYGGYTYLWSVDGTIVSGQNTSEITANFTDGTHLVSVLVTDAQSQSTYGNLYVTSQSSLEFGCPYT
jgi:hypothetical protein